jgi:hypothetical protein
LKYLSKRFTASDLDVVVLREGIEIYLHPEDPIIDFAAYHLSREVQDDQLMASMIAYQLDNAEDEILLVTSDAGLLLMAKAKRQRVGALQCPDHLKLSEQLDPEQVQLREMEAELNKLRNRLPKLDLEFESSDKRIGFKLDSVAEITPTEIQQSIEEVKRKYPKREVLLPEQRAENIGGLNLSELLAAQNPLGTISQEDIVKYNEALDKYYERYEKYLNDKRAFEMVQARLIRIDIQLVNTGTAPAEDIDISMHFPNGFTLLSAGKIPEPPTKPNPPSRLKSAMEIMMEGIGHPMADYYHLLRPNMPHIEAPSNVSAPSIKRTSSYNVGVHVARIKHLSPESLDPLFIVFDSFESASSFHIDYGILTASLPEKVSDKLHVVIQK